MSSASEESDGKNVLSISPIEHDVIHGFFIETKLKKKYVGLIKDQMMVGSREGDHESFTFDAIEYAKSLAAPITSAELDAHHRQPRASINPATRNLINEMFIGEDDDEDEIPELGDEELSELVQDSGIRGC